MVEDVISHSLDKPAIHMSEGSLLKINHLKEWLFENVYTRYPELYPDIHKAKALVKELFHHYCELDNLPEGYYGVQGAIDYVSGMTDRFAMDTYVLLRIPNGFREPA